MVSLQFQHYQTSLVVLTMSCRTERDKEDGDDQCWIRNGTDVEVFNAKYNSSKVAVHIGDTRNFGVLPVLGPENQKHSQDCHSLY